MGDRTKAATAAPLRFRAPMKIHGVNPRVLVSAKRASELKAGCRKVYAGACPIDSEPERFHGAISDRAGQSVASNLACLPMPRVAFGVKTGNYYDLAFLNFEKYPVRKTANASPAQSAMDDWKL